VTLVGRTIVVEAKPAEAFGYLHDPAARSWWDQSVDRVQLEGDAPAAGARLHFRGHRTAPSWIGQYLEYAPPRRSVVTLVEGTGMPFSSYRQTLTVERTQGETRVGFMIDYRLRGPIRLLDSVTVRPRLSRAVNRSLQAVRRHFAEAGYEYPSSEE
jgi:carbon monoxide dehydrogenase subunit G